MHRLLWYMFSHNAMVNHKIGSVHSCRKKVEIETYGCKNCVLKQTVKWINVHGNP